LIAEPFLDAVELWLDCKIYSRPSQKEALHFPLWSDATPITIDRAAELEIHEKKSPDDPSSNPCAAILGTQNQKVCR
jgi:hypothetical protein